MSETLTDTHARPDHEADRLANEPNRNKPWHRKPTITPNFGRRQKIGLKSRISQVLLHDNVSQEQLLRAQLRSLKLERSRSTRLLDLHRKAFLVQQSIKQQHLRATGITHVSLLPENLTRWLGTGGDPNGVTCKPSVPSSSPPKDVTFAVPFDDDDNNKQHDDDDDVEWRRSGEEVEQENEEKTTNGGKSTKSGSALKSGDGSEDVELPPVVLPSARSLSAAVPTAAKPKNFMTHDYHLRREMTATGPGVGTPARLGQSHQGKRRTLGALKDPRYVCLRKTLVPCGKPVDGYLQLSASGQYVLQRYGTPTVDQEHIQRLIREMTSLRQSQHRLSRDPSPTNQQPDNKVDRLIIDHDSIHDTNANEEE